MKWVHLARLLLEILAWLTREAVKREGADAVRAALGAEYGTIVDDLIAKADAARAGVPGVGDERLRDDDGFRRD